MFDLTRGTIKMPRIGKAQRALNSAHDHRDEIERVLADPWMSLYLPESARDWFDAQLRKDRLYLYSKDERRVLAEIIEEMKPFSGFGGYSVSELIDMARPNKWDGDEDTEKFIDELVADRPNNLPLRTLRRLVNVCRMSTPLPAFEGEFALPPDISGEEVKRDWADAPLKRLVIRGSVQPRGTP